MVKGWRKVTKKPKVYHCKSCKTALEPNGKLVVHPKFYCPGCKHCYLVVYEQLIRVHDNECCPDLGKERSES